MIPPFATHRSAESLARAYLERWLRADMSMSALLDILDASDARLPRLSQGLSLQRDDERRGRGKRVSDVSIKEEQRRAKAGAAARSRGSRPVSSEPSGRIVQRNTCLTLSRPLRASHFKSPASVHVPAPSADHVASRRQTLRAKQALLEDHQTIRGNFKCCGRSSDLTLWLVKNIPHPYIIPCLRGCGTLVTYDRDEYARLINKSPADGPFSLTFHQFEYP
jgi:hypothetical protein